MNSEVIIVPVIFGIFGMVVKWLLDYRLKCKLIDKGMVDERVKLLQDNSLNDYAPASLKWGLVFTFIGATVIFIQMLPGYVSGELILGAMLVSGGVGMLLYYFIASAMRKKAESGSQGGPGGKTDL